MEFILRNKVLSAVVVIVVVGVAWYFLSGTPAPDAVLVSEVSAVPPDAQELIESLNTLRSVKLEGSIFANASFQSLKDFSTPILPESIGRTNPFAPLSASEMGSGQ